ncbi:hypothetical protein [Segniliparus rugosus]|uniref:hypothetical protein n=1 Tax=Segniliparus rugosus TaxID=286804 RepID=UPI0001F03C51|nr:hypothetical protein [Segniliparus rugosus]
MSVWGRGLDDRGAEEGSEVVEGDYKRFADGWTGGIGTGGAGQSSPPKLPPPQGGLPSLVIAEDPLAEETAFDSEKGRVTVHFSAPTQQ